MGFDLQGRIVQRFFSLTGRFDHEKDEEEEGDGDE
jgi:hypothetical protein